MGYFAVPILIWLLVCASGVAPLILLRFSNFSPVKDPIPIFKKALSVLDPIWIEDNGFKGMYAIQPLGVPMAIFTNPDKSIAMSVYFAGDQRVVDLVSNFPGSISLTTSTTIDGPVIPNPPGVMMQSFRGCDSQTLLTHHLAGIDFTKKHLETSTVPHGDIASAMQQFIGRQLGHMLTRPWNILTLPYRWAVTRFSRMNLTLEQQAQKGIINLNSLIEQSRTTG